MLVRKDRLFCFSLLFLKVLKSLFWKLKKTAPRKAKAARVWLNLQANGKGNSTKMLILYYLNYLHGLHESKEKWVPSHQRHFIFPVLVIGKVMLLNHVRSTKQVEGSIKSLVCPALASHKLKTFFIWEFEKKDRTQSLGPGKQGLFFLSSEHPTNSSHRNRQGNAKQGSAHYTKDGESCNVNTFGSVC